MWIDKYISISALVLRSAMCNFNGFAFKTKHGESFYLLTLLKLYIDDLYIRISTCSSSDAFWS